MKKKLIKILCIIVASCAGLYLFLFIALGFFHGNFYVDTGVDRTTKEGTVVFVNNGVETPYLAKVDGSGNILDVDFKILCTSDLHLKDDQGEFTVQVLSRFIEKENPDLVVINGDLIVDREDDVMHRKICNIFDTHKTYFALTLGNHDGQEYDGKIDNYREFFFSMFHSDYLITYNDPDAIDGYGNCVINIKTSETKINQSLFFMDTMKDQHTENQIKWYEKRIKEIQIENNNNPVKSTVFSHIQLYEYQTAYDLVQQKSSECTLLYGDRIEKIDGPYTKNGFFDKMVELGSTQAYIAGHDHNSDLSFMYKGINLIFDQPLSYQCYTRRCFWTNAAYFINRNFDYFNDGVNILMIRNDSSFENIPLYAQHEHVFDGLDEYFSKAEVLYFY